MERIESAAQMGPLQCARFHRKPSLSTRYRSLSQANRREAMGLIELLVAISIVGALVGLLLPALSYSREAARRNQCRQNLRQLTQAVLMHEGAQGHYPTGGWGYAWLGDPDRGFAQRQPGGWVYNILPHLESGDLRAIGKGLAPAGKQQSLANLAATPISWLSCPSRPGNPVGQYGARLPPRSAPYVLLVARADYAINSGDLEYGALGPGPESLRDGDTTFRWSRDSGASGISHQRSRVRAGRIVDGTSHTYVLGEKHVAIPGATDDGNDQSMYTGYDMDTCRWTADRPAQDGRGTPRLFGSSHIHGCYMAFLDGSVRLVPYDVSFMVHKKSGNRANTKR